MSTKCIGTLHNTVLALQPLSRRRASAKDVEFMDKPKAKIKRKHAGVTGSINLPFFSQFIIDNK